MRTALKLVLLAVAAAAFTLYSVHVTRACGPFFPEIIFTNRQHPDLPIRSYTDGDLGVLQPSYSSIYLYVAYHDLTGIPFSQAQEGTLWDGNTALTKGEAISRPDLLQKEGVFQGQAHRDWEQDWKSATGWREEPALAPRELYFSWGVVPGEGIYKQTAVRESNRWVSYSQFLNCPQDAFRYALTTLRRLSGQFGETSPVVKNWVEAQGKVFSDCSQGNAIPKPLPASDPAIARQARAYQIAAAQFYSGDYNQAAANFRAIAQDSASPWNTVAPYLVARALVREYTMNQAPVPKPLAALAQAEAQINSVLANPKYAQYRDAAEQLRGFVEFRLHPDQRLVELANNLTNPRGDPNLRQDAIDFMLLFPEVREEGAYTESQPVYPRIYAKLADLRAKSDLIDWLLTFKLDAPEALDHSYEKWKETRSEAWLIAALTKAPPNDPRVPELLATAQQGQGILPSAYDSLAFQRLRLMLLRGETDAVRRQLHLIFARNEEQMRDFGGTPRSTVNLFTATRFELARNLDELFAAAPRVPAMIADTSEAGEMPDVDVGGVRASEPRFDDDAIKALNRFLPVTLLAKAVRSPNVPENLRCEIALAAWTRAALLGDAAVARSLSAAVETFEPKLRPSTGAYASAKTPAARRFAIVLTALRFPGLRPFVLTYPREDWNGVIPLDQIGEYDDRWWGTQGPLCAPPNPYHGRPGYPPVPQWPTVNPVLLAIYPGGQIKPPAFLTASQTAEAAGEWKRLIAMSPAPDYLSAQVLAWAKAHPSDPRVPEALALAVRSTRFGCADEHTGALSKASFDLLHSRYPDSSWAEKTKYWFKM